MQRPSLRGRLAGNDRRSEQRVSEAQPLAVQLEDPRGQRLVERRVGAAADGRFDERHGRIGECCDDPGDLERRRAEAVEAGVQELVESEGIGSSSPRASAPPLRWSARASSSAKNGLPPEVSQSLISVGRGNVASRRARSSSYDRADAQAADLDRLQPSLGHGASKPRRHVAADREQRGDRLAVEAGERVAERREGRGVEPLDVVDREAERAVAGEESKCARGRQPPPPDRRSRTSDSPSSSAASSARR